MRTKEQPPSTPAEDVAFYAAATADEDGGERNELLDGLASRVFFTGGARLIGGGQEEVH